MYKYGYDATCTQTGYEGDLVCSDCNFFIEKGKEIPINPDNHTYEKGETILPTCEEKGYTIYNCACGDSYTDSQTPAKGHSYKTTVTPATCLNGGYTTYTCSCGESYIADRTAATGHHDDNHDGRCDSCDIDTTSHCSCNCHKTGFMAFFWKIINFFQKLFKTNSVCSCGKAHY